VRKNAVGTLGKLEPATLGLLADAVIARLDDSNRHVRAAALDTPGKLEPAALALHANAVVAKLEDTDAAVHVAALQTQGKLEPATLALHANAVVVKLEVSDFSVRVVALWTLGKLEPAALAQHAEAVLARLDDFLGASRSVGCTERAASLRHVWDWPRFGRFATPLALGGAWHQGVFAARSCWGVCGGTSAGSVGVCNALCLVCASVWSEWARACARRGGMGSDDNDD
jgi:hypothetical protein